jgi:hypothetical protein
MRFSFHYIDVADGKTRVIWPALLIFVALTYATVIGGAELFWYGFTGGPSLLIGGYALVAATLVVIRVVGASLFDPYDPIEGRA